MVIAVSSVPIVNYRIYFTIMHYFYELFQCLLKNLLLENIRNFNKTKIFLPKHFCATASIFNENIFIFTWIEEQNVNSSGRKVCNCYNWPCAVVAWNACKFLSMWRFWCHEFVCAKRKRRMQRSPKCTSFLLKNSVDVKQMLGKL